MQRHARFLGLVGSTGAVSRRAPGDLRGADVTLVTTAYELGIRSMYDRYLAVVDCGRDGSTEARLRKETLTGNERHSHAGLHTQRTLDEVQEQYRQTGEEVKSRE